MISLGFNIEHHEWIIFICFIVSIGLSFLFYKKNNSVLEEVFERKPLLRYVLITLRTLSLFALFVLLLNPILKYAFTHIEKPQIVIAQDNSESIKYAFLDENRTFDSLKFEAYSKQIHTLKKKLEEKFEVNIIHFSNVIRNEMNFDLSGKATNFSNLLNDINTQYTGQNLNSLIIASDGIYNKGINPLYNDLKTDFSIYTLGLGDTSSRKDLRINKINFNPIVYLDNDFALEALIGSNNYKGNTSIKIEKFDSTNKKITIAKKTIRLDNNFQNKKERFIINAAEKGMQHFRVSLTLLEGEEIVNNNSRDVFIEVIDNRQRILILSEFPHPDINAYQAAISNNKSFHIEYENLNNLTTDISNYDLVILYQIPSIKNKASHLLSQLKLNKTPLLFVIGNNSNNELNYINSIQKGVTISPYSNQYNEVNPFYNPDFLLFKIDKKTLFTLNHLPPLTSPASVFVANPSLKTFIYQKIGSVNTDYPLFAFYETQNEKHGYIIGEGFWKWRIHDYLINGDHQVTNELISKVVQYMALKTDKRKFRVKSIKHHYVENEEIEFSAKLFNDSYELINDPEIEIILKSTSGQEYPFQFKRTTNAYELNIGSLPKDIYKYHAKTSFNNQNYLLKGEISVSPIQLESLNPQANHALLKQLALNFDGDFQTLNEIDSFTNNILNRSDIKPITYTKYKTNSIINILWLFFLLILPISLEWFLRKWFGSY